MDEVSYSRKEKRQNNRGEGVVEGSSFASFLLADFNQCFEQMRHYDNQQTSILKFILSGYTALFGGAFALYKVFTDNLQIYTFLAIFLLFGFLSGVLLLASLVRNRAYIVVVARYINANRGLFLSKKPLGFENPTGMYTTHNVPFFNPMSLHSFMIYFVSFFNSSIFASSFYIYRISINKPSSIKLSIILIILITGIQMYSAIKYLKNKNNKNADKAIFGRRGKKNE